MKRTQICSGIEYRERRTKNKITSQVHLMTVPNNADGNALIRAIRNNIKKSRTGRRVILYGRGHRFGKGRSKASNGFDNSLQSGVPLTVAQNIAVYIFG